MFTDKHIARTLFDLVCIAGGILRETNDKIKAFMMAARLVAGAPGVTSAVLTIDERGLSSVSRASRGERSATRPSSPGCSRRAEAVVEEVLGRDAHDAALGPGGAGRVPQRGLDELGAGEGLSSVEAKSQALPSCERRTRCLGDRCWLMFGLHHDGGVALLQNSARSPRARQVVASTILPSPA